MKDSSYYIREIKRAQGVDSDYAVAKLLGVTRGMMTKYNNGSASFDSDIALTVADLSGHNPAEVLADAKAHRSRDPIARRRWAALARSLAGTAAALVVTLALLIQPAQVDHAGAGGVYIMLSIAITAAALAAWAFRQPLIGHFVQGESHHVSHHCRHHHRPCHPGQRRAALPRRAYR